MIKLEIKLENGIDKYKTENEIKKTPTLKYNFGDHLYSFPDWASHLSFPKFEIFVFFEVNDIQWLWNKIPHLFLLLYLFFLAYTFYTFFVLFSGQL